MSFSYECMFEHLYTCEHKYDSVCMSLVVGESVLLCMNLCLSEYLCVLICRSEFVSMNTHISMFVCSECLNGLRGMILFTYDYICVKACMSICVSVNVSVFLCLNL